MGGNLTDSPTGTSKKIFLGSLQRRDTRMAGLPTELTIEITSRCQLACVICPRETLHKDLVHNREMAWDLYERLAERYVPALDYLSLAGGLGEPLLYSRFGDAVRLARSLNPTAMIGISTNALLPRTIRALDPVFPLLTEVQLSMDAVGADFDRIVGQADAFPVFERTVRALIPMAEQAGTTLKFNSVVTPESFQDLETVLETIGEWGGRNLYLNGMNLVATDIDPATYDFYITDRYVEKMDALTERGREIGVEVGWHDMRTITGFEGCYAPWNNFYIAWNGLLAGCCAKPFPELINFGHVEEPGLAERINDEALVRWREMSLANVSPDFCKNCGAQHRPRTAQEVSA